VIMNLGVAHYILTVIVPAVYTLIMREIEKQSHK
jgi:hypothetical protein